MNKVISIFSVIVIMVVVLITTNCQKEPTPPDYISFTDNRDGEIYKYVKIGNQYWMSENLRFKPDSGNYWVYSNFEINIKTHGYLYDWETANNVCPTGWHLPSNDEWKELSDELGGSGVAGGKMKVAGTSYWNPPNEGATNSSGFSALPSGSYMGNDIFDGMGNLTHFWSSEISLNIWWLSTNFSKLGSSIIDMPHASASVRCVKD